MQNARPHYTLSNAFSKNMVSALQMHPILVTSAQVLTSHRTKLKFAAPQLAWLSLITMTPESSELSAVLRLFRTLTRLTLVTRAALQRSLILHVLKTYSCQLHKLGLEHYSNITSILT